MAGAIVSDLFRLICDLDPEVCGFLLVLFI